MASAVGGDWATAFENQLEEKIERPDNPQQGQSTTIFRIPKRTKDLLASKDRSSYEPEDISLGLFHRWRRDGEDFKLKMARAFFNSVQPDPAEGSVGQRWRNLCQTVVGRDDLMDALNRYDLHGEDRIKGNESESDLQCALALDAIVVGCFFGVKFCRENRINFRFVEVQDCVAQQNVYGGLHVEDFLKLENQIPLRLLRNVLKVVYTDTSSGDKILNGACAKVAADFVSYLPGFDHIEDVKDIKQLQFLACDHLLGCVAYLLEMDRERSMPRSEDEGSGSRARNLCGLFARGVGKLWQERVLRLNLRCFRQQRHGGVPSGAPARKSFSIPSATQLRKAGIKVQGRSRGRVSELLPEFVQGWLMATLFVPTLSIRPTITWTLYRNIVAYECAKKDRQQESQLHAFLALMDCLVDTPDDVLLLTQGEKPVLCDGYYSTPDDPTMVFNTILLGQPFVHYKRWMDLADKINTYHKRRVRRCLLNLLRTYFGNWLFVGAIAGILLFVLTLLQTVYTMWTFKKTYKKLY